MRQRYIATHLAASLPSLTPEALRGLAGQAALVRYPPGAVIIRQSEAADTFYIIARGLVDVINQRPGGQEMLLAQRGPGEYFGEAGLMQRRARTATVRAAPDAEVELLEISRAAFEQLMTDSPATGEMIARRMVERLMDLLKAEEGIAASPAP